MEIFREVPLKNRHNKIQRLKPFAPSVLTYPTRTPEGKVLKDVGRVNSRLVLDRFGVNSQPNYFILDGEGNILAGPRGYNLDTDGFVKFLDL